MKMNRFFFTNDDDESMSSSTDSIDKVTCRGPLHRQGPMMNLAENESKLSSTPTVHKMCTGRHVGVGQGRSALLALSILSTMSMAVLASAASSSSHIQGGGYLTAPPSRNYLAYTQNTHLPSSSSPLSSLPEMEPTPHLLNSGGRCGTTATTTDYHEHRDYNTPKNRMNTLLPLNIQGIHLSADTIQVTVNLFGAPTSGGHFEFSVCPLEYPNEPTEDCFDKYPLEFVKDEYYGASHDEMYPERVHVPHALAFNDSKKSKLQKVYANESGPGGTESMMEFKYTLKLPTNNIEDLTTDIMNLENGGIPQGSVGIDDDTDSKNRSQKTIVKKITLASQFLLEDSTGEYLDRNKNNNNRHLLQQENDKQWIATRANNVSTYSPYETVLISSVSTDGNGTTTIVTLNGGVTVIEDGPKIPSSSTLTYGFKEVYGSGIPLSMLPVEVQEELLQEEEEEVQIPTTSSSTAEDGAGSRGRLSRDGAGAFTRPFKGFRPEEDGAEEANNASSSSSKYVLLRWHYVTARDDCHPPGYDTYNWPKEWGDELIPRSGGECNDQGAYQEEYWNCAEILILASDYSPSLDKKTLQEAIPKPRSKQSLVVANNAEASSAQSRTQAKANKQAEANSSTRTDENNNKEEVFAKDDRASTTVGKPVTIDVTANDIGQDLVVTNAHNGRHGSCQVTYDNQILYTPTIELQQEGVKLRRDRCAYITCIEGTMTPFFSNGGPNAVCDEGWVYVQIYPKSGSGDSSSAPETSSAAAAAVSTEDNSVSVVESQITSENDDTRPVINVIGGTLTGSLAAGTITAVDDGIVTAPNTPVRIDVAANDVYSTQSSIENARLVITEITSQASHGTCITITASSASLTNTIQSRTRSSGGQNIIVDTNQVMYTPALTNFQGTDSCSYKICLWGVGLGNNDVCDEGEVIIRVDANYGQEEEELVVATTTTEATTATTTSATATDTTTTTTATTEASPKPELITEPTDQSMAKDILANKPDIVVRQKVVVPLSEKAKPEYDYTPLDILPTNKDPNGNRDAVTTQGQMVDIDVLANDRDGDGDSFGIYSLTEPAAGRVKRVNTRMRGNYGVLRYTPDEGFVGKDLFVVTICDSTNRCGHSRVAVDVIQTVEVFAEEDEATTAVGATPLAIDVTANDYTSSTKPLQLTNVGAAKHGVCDISRNKIRYTPPSEDNEDGFWDRCSYTVCSDCKCDNGRVEIRVLPSPVFEKQETSSEKLVATSKSIGNGESSNTAELVYAKDEAVTTHINVPIIVDVSSNSNDFVQGTGQLTLRHTSGATNGKCRITQVNSLKYMPRKDFMGTDYCEFMLCQKSMCDKGMLKIEVVDVAKEPSRNMNRPMQQQQKWPSSLRPRDAILCQSQKGTDRHLRGGNKARQLPKKSKESACVGSSLITTDGEISYTSTYLKKKHPQSSSKLRYGKARSIITKDKTDEGEPFIETVISVPASADAVIMPGFPDNSFGNVPSMLVSSATSDSGMHETLIQFQTHHVDISVCAKGVSIATLSLYSLAKSSQGGTFITTSVTTWLEDQVTWNNAPISDGIVLSDIGLVEAHKWVVVDVLPALIFGETLSIRIVSSNEDEQAIAQYASKDHLNPSLKPVLNITCLSSDVNTTYL